MTMPKKKISITIEIPVWEKIKKTAETQCRSVSSMINWLCRKAEGFPTSDDKIDEVEDDRD